MNFFPLPKNCFYPQSLRLYCLLSCPLTPHLPLIPKFISVFTVAHNWLLALARLIHTAPPHPFNVIIHLCVTRSSLWSPSDYKTIIFYKFVTIPKLCMCPGNPNCDFITLVIIRNIQDVSHYCVLIGATRFCRCYHLILKLQLKKC